MKKIHRVLAMLMAAIMALSLITIAFAEPTIDPGKKASLSIYKYNITKAGNDGAWDAESYVSTGLHDDAVIDKLAKYAIQGVEFTYLRVADIAMNNEVLDGQRQVGVLYGFDNSDRSTAVLSAIGLTAADAHKTEGGVNYFTSDALNSKLATALAANATNVKNALETAVKNGGVAMPETDASGHTSASNMEQGLYLVVETRVPENVTSTCNPFFVSLPMTTVDGAAWNYDVTVYPKNQTGTSSQYGNQNLTLENCYNAGDLQVGTAATLVGSLAGYPIDGRYYTGLTVRKGACRFVMGWKCSQGDSVKESAVLTADSLFEGLVDSIGGVNSGYPLFDWQLLEQQSREEVVSCLNDRYEREIKPIATAAQCEEIEKLLAETAETIRTAKTTAEMTAAYEKVLARMSADDLLAAAKEAAQKQLDKLYGSAKKNYKDIAEQLNKLYETQKAAIEACTKSADTDTELDRFSAGVVDLLITARVKTGVTMKELSATLPEVTAAYKELTAAQKEMLVNGKKLTDAQNLLATYERDLESLDQWVDSDKTKYSAVKTELGKLAAETRTKLEGCTSAAGMTKVLNDYSAGVARLLLEKLNFTAGKTTLGELNKLSQVIEQASAAINGLTEEQKALLEKAQVANCAAAKELLAVYTKAVESLNKWSSEDQSKYTDLNTALNSLAATARKELEASVDRDGAAKALNGYCAGVVMELIKSVGTVKTVMTEQEAAQVKSKIQRAQAAYGNLSDDQKKLVTNYAALQAADTAYKTYEQNYAAAKNVMELIKSIGKVNEVMTRTEADAVKKKIQTAQDAYNKLTAEQKQMVTNYADLQAAAAAYQTYETNYAAAKATENLIRAIGTVTKDSYDAIQKATEAYNKLTATQKKLVDAKLVQQLQDASARYKELLEQTTDANGEKVPTDQLLVPDEVQTEDTPFDWSIVWISLGILAAAGVITFVIRWFIAMRRAKQKKET